MADALNFHSLWGRIFTVPNLTSAYKAVFRSDPGANVVLPDIAEFCWAGKTPPRGMTDPVELGRFIGRQEVYNHIRDHIHLEEAELVRMYQAKSIQK